MLHCLALIFVITSRYLNSHISPHLTDSCLEQDDGVTVTHAPPVNHHGNIHHQPPLSQPTFSIESHARQITCRSFWSSESSDTTGSAFPNLQLHTPIQSRSLAGKTLCSAGVWTHPISGTESHAHIEEEKVGVLLLNLGGPETLNDVQPFLYNLFADPDIIRLPRLFRFLQRPLAKLISTLRASKSKEGYASIGGGSPMRKITDEQADALKMALEAKEVPVH